LERLGIPAGSYVVRVNNRKLLDGVMEAAGLPADAGAMRLTVLRAIDKLDRIGLEGVGLLLGKGREDESGDFTKGAGLKKKQITCIMDFLSAGAGSNAETLAAAAKLVKDSEIGRQGVEELRQMDALLAAAGFDALKVKIEPSVVRGLEYYTGPVFEAELTYAGGDGTAPRFGSVASGGRYDGLVERFKGTRIPATGCSIGVSRLYAALNALGKLNTAGHMGPVVVMVMDRDRLGDYQGMVRDLRTAGIRAEMYLGESGLKAQMKYADKRGAPCVIIQGGDERERGEVTIKDLIEGSRAAAGITDRAQYREARPAQIAVKTAEMLTAVREILSRHETPALVAGSPALIAKDAPQAPVA
jgi:histidyl-tRNA synthetase